MTLHQGKQLLRQFLSACKPHPLRRRSTERGLTLIETIVASLVMSVVIFVAWSGLISVFNMSSVAEAKTARLRELNQALDFVTNELRTAQHINATNTLNVNGTTVPTVENLLTSSGFNLSRLGAYGEISLYLERPTKSLNSALCPVGGPNAGTAPPAPVDYDPIVYDIRLSPSNWLAPRTLMRYGRVPNQDGTIDPCRNPIASEPIADALAASTSAPPSCSGVLSGTGGFHVCVSGNKAELFFQSELTGVKTRQISSSVTSRVMAMTSVTSQPEIMVSIVPDPGNPSVFSIAYSWPNSGGSGATYKLYKQINGVETLTAFGATISYSSTYPAQQHCFRMEGTSATGKTAQSNVVCTS